MRLFSQAIAAAAQWPLAIRGDYFRLHGANTAVDVTFWKNGVPVDTIVGMLAGTWMRLSGGFDRVDILNGATAQTIQAIIGQGEGGVDRILGEVSVIDGGKSRVLAGSGFFYFGTSGAVAGQYSYVALKNEAAAGGKNLVINQVLADCGGANVAVRLCSMAGAVGAAGAWGAAKLVGGADSVVGRAYTGTDVSAIGAGLAGRFRVGSNSAFRPTEPVIVPPTKQIIVIVDTVNTPLYVSLDGFEE